MRGQKPQNFAHFRAEPQYIQRRRSSTGGNRKSKTVMSITDYFSTWWSNLVGVGPQTTEIDALVFSSVVCVVASEVLRILWYLTNGRYPAAGVSVGRQGWVRQLALCHQSSLVSNDRCDCARSLTCVFAVRRTSSNLNLVLSEKMQWFIYLFAQTW